jgi:hypothetical protein
MGLALEPAARCRVVRESWPRIAVAGAAITLSTLPGLNAGARRRFASSVVTKTMRSGAQLAEVGPIFVRS